MQAGYCTFVRLYARQLTCVKGHGLSALTFQRGRHLRLNGPLGTGGNTQVAAVTSPGIDAQLFIVEYPGISWTDIDTGLTSRRLNEYMDTAPGNNLRKGFYLPV